MHTKRLPAGPKPVKKDVYRAAQVGGQHWAILKNGKRWGLVKGEERAVKLAYELNHGIVVFEE